MKSIYVALTCRNCGYQTHKQSETLILSDFEPYLKKQLIDETYFSAICPCCKNKIDFLHPCLFVEKKYRYILFIKAKHDQKDTDHLLYQEKAYCKRYVDNTTKIKETMKILEDGYDDRAIAIMKLKLLLHLRKQEKHPVCITYFDSEKEQSSIWFKVKTEEGEEMMAVHMQIYDNILNILPKDDHEHYQNIDLEWAIQFQKKNLKQK
ncbi:CpXC domain-containing protein [Amedibacterium intestinale]|uniref:CpXC domain-containing protein n=1 Tax=Amedibacterium intestinale TaxID=2583452 RepID=UPI000E481A1E|nr:CpXC domain-containing protein [Amedibacterium intestinale]RHO28006.1 hypothetical protein DW208_09965 [Erysipelotrichaceae bacterium AM17-60]BBK62348.1 hypothetical protein A9CBEGH2_12880 [Amedibacterium intestinale]